MDQTETVTVDACTRCAELVESRSQIVDGVGPIDADLLFVGEAPGEQEDTRGEPFVGRSGSILDEVLLGVGLEREAVRITNCVKCRPPDNRDPRSEELANCREYLDREISVVDPAAIVTLGKVPSEHLLGRSVAVTSEAGSVHEIRIDGETYRVLISVHPAAILYDRSQRETFESTLERAAGFVGSGTAGGQSRIDRF